MSAETAGDPVWTVVVETGDNKMLKQLNKRPIKKGQTTERENGFF